MTLLSFFPALAILPFGQLASAPLPVMLLTGDLRADSREEARKALSEGKAAKVRTFAEQKGYRLIESSDGLLVFDPNSLGLIELEIKNSMLSQVVQGDQILSLDKGGAFGSEFLARVCSIEPNLSGRLQKTNLDVSLTPSLSFRLKSADGSFRSLDVPLMHRQKPEPKDLASEGSSTSSMSPSVNLFGPQNNLGEYFYGSTNALVKARMRKFMSDHLLAETKRLKDDFDLNKSRILAKLDGSTRKLAEKIRSQGQIQLSDLSSEDQSFLASLAKLQGIDMSDFSKIQITGASLSMAAMTRIRHPQGYILNLGHIFDLSD